MVDASFSFIHAADLHLDSPFRGLEQVGDVEEPVKENVLRRLRQCTFAALDNIVDACIDHQVDFLILAGDIYDAASRSIRAELYFRKAVQRLAKYNIEALVVYGNHDPDKGLRQRLTWPGNVYFFSSQAVESHVVARRGREIARVYGRSYPQRDVKDNYALEFQRDDGVPFAIGVLHTNVGGVAGYENYAPCRVDDLLRAGMDYWALGHVHSRQVLHDGFPYIVYPGTPQGRNPRETGEKGCYLVQVAGNGLVDLQFLPVDDVRWMEIDLSIEGLENEDELLNYLDAGLEELRQNNAGKSLVVRVNLSGRGRLHHDLGPALAAGILSELRLRFAGEQGDFLWLESIKCNTGLPADKTMLRKGETLLADLLSLCEDGRNNAGLRAELEQILTPTKGGMAPYLPALEDGEWDGLLEAAEDLAIDLLWEEE